MRFNCAGRALGCAIGLAAMSAVLAPAQSQPYPSQPIKIIVGTAAGGVADIAGRTLAQAITEAGKTAVVENRTGAGGSIAAGFVAKAPPDGYTVLVGFHATQSILQHLQTLSYDPAKDFAAVTIAVMSSNILVINKALPSQSLKDLIAHAKANPGKLSYASQGGGSSGHILGEQFKIVAGIDVAHVSYRGAAPAVQDLVAGHVSMMFDILALALPQVRADTVRALVITAPEPHPLFPGVPTAKQAGFPQLEGGPWFGFFLPAGTPAPIVEWLYNESKRAFATPEGRERFTKQGLSVILGTPAETTAFVARETKRWGDVIRAANIKMQ